MLTPDQSNSKYENPTDNSFPMCSSDLQWYDRPVVPLSRQEDFREHNHPHWRERLPVG
jgi:hypothetical protein